MQGAQVRILPLDHSLSLDESLFSLCAFRLLTSSSLRTTTTELFAHCLPSGISFNQFLQKLLSFRCTLDKDSKYFEISDRSLNEIILTIKTQTNNIVVVNDGDTTSFVETTFKEAREKLNNSLSAILSEKSSFEV